MSTPIGDGDDRYLVKRSRRSQQERRNLAERALLSATRRLVSRRGVDQTSVADIGEEAGYSRGLVNHRFGSKAALLQQLALDSQKAVEDMFREGQRDELESVTELSEVYLRWVDDKEEDARAFFAMWGSSLPDESILRRVFVEIDEKFRVRFGDILARGQRTGTIRADVDAAAASAILVAMLRGTGMQRLIAANRVDLTGIRETVEVFIRRALAPERE